MEEPQAAPQVASAVNPRANPPLSEALPLRFTYTNWRGETAERAAIPGGIYWGATDWHPEPQWLMRALDVEKGQERDFALRDCVFAPMVPVAGTIADALAHLEAARETLRAQPGPNPGEYGAGYDAGFAGAVAALRDLARAHTMPPRGPEPDTLAEARKIVEELPGFRLKDGGGLVGDKVAGHWLNRFRVLGALGADMAPSQGTEQEREA